MVLPLPTEAVNYTYNRAQSLVFYLVNAAEIWIYTVKTDPACRIAVWNVSEMLENTNFDYCGKQPAKIPVIEGMSLSPFDGSLWKAPQCECCCIASLSSHLYFSTVEGTVCANSEEFLLLGLEDGRMLFMDTELENTTYYEIQAHKDPVILMKHDVAHNQLLSVSQEHSEKRLKIWSLPKLQLLHEVPVPQEVVTFSRIGSQLCLGLKGGMIVFSDIVATDSMVLSFSPILTQDSDARSEWEEKRAMDQTGQSVITDACSKQNIFLSCSGDDVLKIWDMYGFLLTEVVLDYTLTFACFLNNQGDILIGFKDHLFLIPHKKLMIAIMDAVSDSSAKESYIYEDPAIKYELKDQAQIETEAALDMDSYLVPFKYLEVLAKLKEDEPISLSYHSEGEDWDAGETEAVRSVSFRYSPVPTGVYNSPASSVISLEVNPRPEADKQEGTWSMIHPSEECAKWLQCTVSELAMPELGDSPINTPIPEQVALESQTESEMENDVTVESAIPSMEDFKKRLHISRAAVTVFRLQPAIEMNWEITDVSELLRRGLKIDRFLIGQQQRTKTGTLMPIGMQQPLFLDIYKNKAALNKRSRKKSAGPKRKLKIPSFTRKSRKKPADTGNKASGFQTDGKAQLSKLRKPESSAGSTMDWINAELQSREVLKKMRSDPEALTEERGLLQEVQRVERPRSLPRHKSSFQAQAVKQVDKTSTSIIQSCPQPLTSRLCRRVPYPMSLAFPPFPPLAGKPTAPGQPALPEDPQNRMYVVVRDTYAPPKMPVPTPLEERLLKERFPNYKLPFTKHGPRLIERKVYTPSTTTTCIPLK
uniref:uncharacterized protein n=1 Tax=Pristiophorus japonicus TaxID=55135 RepID=UPI00398F5DDE